MMEHLNEKMEIIKIVFDMNQENYIYLFKKIEYHEKNKRNFQFISFYGTSHKTIELQNCEENA